MRNALLASLLATACAMTPAPDRDAATLADAERAFAAQSMATDMASAFRANFSDDGVLVGEGWTRARAAFAGQPAPPVNLDWAPSHVEVAGSGELGLSTGPWIRTSRLRPDEPAAHGHFVSVWRRNAQGRWQVEVDIGIRHPEAVAKPASAEVVAPGAPIAGGGSLEEAEARFVQASIRGGPLAAYEAHASQRFMLYREGHAPYRGKAQALMSGSLREGPTLWLTDAMATSRSNDFGFVRGTYADAADPQKARGYFMRVWRREAVGWRVVLDVTNAAR